MNFKFSIIVPVYNAEEFLEQCIQSVLAQSYKQYQLILVDNGSKDSSRDIIEKYEHDRHIEKYTILVNDGISGARNLGIQKALGDYIVFLDSDDFYIDPYFLDRLNRKLNHRQTDLVLFKSVEYLDLEKKYGKYRSDFNVSYLNGVSEKNDVILYLAKSGFLKSACWDKAVSRQVLMDAGLYFKERIRGEDVEWYYRVLKNIRSISALDGKIHAHRIVKTSASMQPMTFVIWKNIYGFLRSGYSDIDVTDMYQAAMLDNYVNFWFILLAMTNLYTGRKKMLQRKLKNMDLYMKIGMSRKNQICRLIVNLFGYRTGSRILYRYIMRKR